MTKLLEHGLLDPSQWDGMQWLEMSQRLTKSIREMLRRVAVHGYPGNARPEPHGVEEPLLWLLANRGDGLWGRQ